MCTRCAPDTIFSDRRSCALRCVYLGLPLPTPPASPAVFTAGVHLSVENCRASTSIKNNFQATKSQRWMPWRQMPMKDVDGCEKPRGAAYQASIRGCPNGETHHGCTVVPRPEHIGSEEGTRGIETSQYPVGKESNSDSLSSGERRGKSLNRCSGTACRRCCNGVVGSNRECGSLSRSYQVH